MTRKKICPIVTLIAFSLGLFTTPLIPQTEDGGKLIGFIYKSDKKTPLKDTKVILVSLDGNRRYESNITDDKGDYTFENIPEGSYNVYLEINDKEFKIQRVDFVVHIESGKTSFMSFSINKRFPFIIIIPIGTLAFIPYSYSPTTR